MGVALLERRSLGAAEDLLYVLALEVGQVGRWDAAGKIPGDRELVLPVLLSTLDVALDAGDSV